MKNKSLTIIILQSVLIIGLVWLIIYLGKDEIFKEVVDADSMKLNESEVENLISIKEKFITLPNSIIKNSGI